MEFELSQTSDDDRDYGIVSEVVSDDKMLCDLHLNSALNLDQLDFHLGKCMKYSMQEDKKIKRSLQRGRQQLGRWGKYSNQVCRVPPSAGMIPVKVALSKITDKTMIWPDSVTPQMLQHLHECLKTRGYHSSFNAIQTQMNEDKLVIPIQLFECFNSIMSLCMCISEKIRGGRKPESIGQDMDEAEEWITTTLFVKTKTSERSPVVFGADGTTTWVVFDGQVYISTWEDLLALLDTLGQRICLILIHQMAKTIHEPGSIPLSINKSIIDKLDETLLLYGNEGYRLIGMFETLCVAVILKKADDGINDSLELTRNMLDEIGEMGELLNINKNELIKRFDILYRELESLQDDQLSNLFCQYRIWGHPYVDVYEGLKKVKSIGTKHKDISDFYPRYMVRHFKEFVVLGLYKKKNRYPKDLIESCKTMDKRSYIVSCISENHRIEKYHSCYVVEDWDMITLPSVFKIPDTYDLTHILNDKAVSPKMSELVQAVNENISLERMNGRRGILSWLKGNTINCRAFLASIQEKGLDDDDLVIGMYEKEREMKIEARMFALMSENMRYYFVITEGMIADHILQFFPQITMKDSLNKLQKKFWTAGAGKGRGRFNTNINIDFSKWNTNMRGRLMNPLFAEMDNLFGVQHVISRTHEIFSSSTIYSSSGKYVPTVVDNILLEDGPMCYRGHMGGMEGLRQKGWTVGTVCLIDYVARFCKVKYKLMGQGDNQIIQLIMNDAMWTECEWSEDVKRMEARKITEGFERKLEEVFNEVGLPIKPKECWKSANLFMYGKAMLLNQTVLPQWSKKLLRSYALSNEGILTLGGTIGTIAANCMSSCPTMLKPELGYACYLMLANWTLNFLLMYHPFSRTEDICSLRSQIKIPGKSRPVQVNACSQMDLRTVLLLIPTPAAGSVNIPFTTYIFRGFPDTASEAYSWIKLLYSGGNEHIARIARNYYSYLEPSTTHLEQLVEAPLSINHVRVLSPTLSIRQETKETIRNSFREQNNVVYAELEIEELYKGIPLADSLATDPLNPLLFSDVLRLFPNHVASELLGRVSATRTIKKLALSHAKHPIVKRLQQAEVTFVQYLKWRNSQQGIIVSECATEHTRQIRNVGWGREIIEVTTPHPLEVTSISCFSDPSCNLNTDYIYLLKDTNGGFSPYLGSSVKNKVQGGGDENLRKEPLLKDVFKLSEYANWMKLGPQYKRLLSDFSHFYGGSITQSDVEFIFSLEGNYTGSADHRYQSGMQSEGCFINYSPQIGTNIFMSSDNMIEYGKGNTNVTLHFQALYCWIQYMVTLTPLLRSGHCHINCRSCVVPTVDAVPDIEPSSHLILQESRPHIQSILGISPDYQLAKDHQNADLKDLLTLKLMNLGGVKMKYLRHSLTYYLAVRLGLELMGQCLDISEEFEVGLADLQKYPRIYGKKIYSDELIFITAHICLIVGCIDRKMGTHGLDLYRSKRYVIDRLSHLSNEQIGCLGSLTIEENIRCREQYQLVDSGVGCFPKTLSEHLKRVLSTLKRHVANIGCMSSAILPAEIYLPSQDLSDIELSFHVVIADLLINRCGRMLGAFSNDRSSETILGVLCPKGHMQKMLKRIVLVDGIGDKMFKMLSIAVPVSYEQPKISCAPLPNWREMRLYKTPKSGCRFITQPILYRHLSNNNNREIVLPTSSVYKWDEILRCVTLRKHVIFLGDGTGTSSRVCAGIFPNSIVYPMGLFERCDVIPQDLGSFYPAMSRGIKNISYAALTTLPDNVEDENFPTSLKDFVYHIGVDKVTLVSDIEMRGGSIWGGRNLTDILSIGCQCLFKGYLKEFSAHPVIDSLQFCEFSVHPSSLGNVEYYEMFVSCRVGSIGYVDGTNIYKEIMESLQMYDEEGILNRTYQISNEYKFLRQTSYSLALKHLDSMGFFINMETVLWETTKLLMYYFVFINTHFMFSSEKRSVRGKRRLTPLRRCMIERIFAILLIMTSQVINMELVKKIKLITIATPINSKYQYKKVFKFVEGQNVQLTKKDLQCAKTLGLARIRAGIRPRRIRSYNNNLSEDPGECFGFLQTLHTMMESFNSSNTWDSGVDVLIRGE
ncbi:TPA_asm: polyprotein [Amentotaxus virus 1]|uniref:Replicase n=1 Tax=Amentotaxus virus 1 TaxID=2977950 RepID=A0A9N7AB16_9RHAB|nr:TPA_asm: polyprotein [Amentotaxus virus 1]